MAENVHVGFGTAGREGSCNACSVNEGPSGLINPSSEVVCVTLRSLGLRLCRPCARELRRKLTGV
jgi:hypothetical protein